MTDTTTSGDREFRIGPIFGHAWSVYSSNFLKFTLVSIVIALPSLLTGGDQSAAGGVRSFIAVIVGVVFYLVGQAVILYGAFQALRGREVLMGEATRRGLARFWPIIGISVLVMLAFVLGGVVVGLAAAALAPVGIILGLVFVVLIFMFMVRWSMAVPACVVEGLGPIASLRRSAELTKGNRWKIFGMFALISIVVLLVSVIVLTVIKPLAGAGLGEILGGFVVASIIGLIASAIYSAYFNIVQALIYHDLRVAKEGIDTDQIASVFD
jgi:hypothetical protein